MKIWWKGPAQSLLPATIAAISLLSACAPAGSSPGTPAPSADAISWQSVAAAGKIKGDDAPLHALLSNSSHQILTIRGVRQVYFAADGTAYFKDAQTGDVERGWWATMVAAPFYGHSICSGRGSQPDDMAGSPLVEFCTHSSSWVGTADNIQRGDTYQLAKVQS
ncbi:MAG: hypothetical protein H7245_11545 [Candidatus Saccharibacteria bacterium]|nr:hypothetical protein [Pseudorhodobacter sp.]